MPFTSFEQLKEAFESKMNEATNSTPLIKREINAIDQFLYGSFNTNNTFRVRDYSNFTSVFQIIDFEGYRGYRFTQVFEKYLSKGIDSIVIEDERERTTIEAALSFAKYYEWLEGLQNPKSKSKKADLSLNQKLLALHYLGMDFSQFENSKLAVILSGITGQGKENIRKSLSYVNGGKNNKVRTKANLDKLNKLFEKADFTEVSDKINKDLEKL